MEQDKNNVLEQQEPFITGQWSWGAFFFGPLWGVFNGVYWPIIVIVGLNVISWVLPDSIKSAAEIIVTAIGFFISIYLGNKGNELAWNNKQWDSAEQFEKVQHKWAVAAGITVAICAGIFLIMIGYASSI